MLLSLSITSLVTWLWIIIFAIALTMELLTVDLICIWFAIGALVALVLEALSVPLGYEILAFLVTSLILVFTVGRYARKALRSKNETNVDAIKGMEVILLKETSRYELGEAKINGVIWSTTTLDDATYKEGDKVVVKKIEGNKVFVSNN